MRSTVRRHAVVVGIILMTISLNDQLQPAVANERSDREKSAFCRAVVGPAWGKNPRAIGNALMKFAGYRRASLNLPWENLFQRQPTWTGKRSAPTIMGLPMESAPAPSLLVLSQTVDVTVGNSFFLPSTVHIAVGDTVRWTWNSSPHSVTAGTCISDQYEDCNVSGLFCSPNDLNCIAGTTSGVGTIYSHQFNTAGSFPYFCKEHLGFMTGTIIVDPAPTSPTIQLSSGTYNVAEAGGVANVTVSRTGSTANAASVDYATSDTAGLTNCNVVNGVGSARCDYATSVGTARFAAGETSKTVTIPIVDDSYAEGGENFMITLSNAVNVTLGAPSSATVTINDNEASNGANPIDGTAFFVRQQYVDFLNREPDPGGFAAWQAVINGCALNDPNCDRIHVSSAFFRSPEFQDRGYFVYRFYPVSFGRKPEFVEFTPDIAKVSGFLSDAELEAAKVAFVTSFMNRPAFITKFNGLNNTEYVDTLLLTAGVTSMNRDFWIAALGNGTRTRATVLRDIAESLEVYNKYYNQAFVVMQYFGYLRRDPDGLYVNWIAVLDSSPSDFRGMVNGFMNSLEYRFRFGP